MSDTPLLPRIMLMSEFEPLVGQYFVANCDPEPVKIKLVDVKPLTPSGLDIRPPFIMIFHTPPNAYLVGGHYVMRCGQFGPEVIHIASMIAPPNAEPGYYYQSVFN